MSDSLEYSPINKRILKQNIFQFFLNLHPVDAEVSMRKVSPAYTFHMHQESYSATREQDLSKPQNGAKRNHSLIFRAKRGEEENGRNQQWQN